MPKRTASIFFLLVSGLVCHAVQNSSQAPFIGPSLDPDRFFVCNLILSGYFAHISYISNVVRYAESQSLKPFFFFYGGNYFEHAFGDNWLEYFFYQKGLSIGERRFISRVFTDPYIRANEAAARSQDWIRKLHVGILRILPGGATLDYAPALKKHEETVIIPRALRNRTSDHILLNSTLLIKDWVQQAADEFASQHFFEDGGRRRRHVLGIHYRGTDKGSAARGEAPRVEYAAMSDAARTYLHAHPDSAVFVATDEEVTTRCPPPAARRPPSSAAHRPQSVLMCRSHRRRRDSVRRRASIPAEARVRCRARLSAAAARAPQPFLAHISRRLGASRVLSLPGALRSAAAGPDLPPVWAASFPGSPFRKVSVAREDFRRGAGRTHTTRARARTHTHTHTHTHFQVRKRTHTLMHARTYAHTCARTHTHAPVRRMSPRS
jgi:hypothetical protein